MEIFNDIGIDTTLRWKCHYSNVPAQWNANFDDQNMFYPGEKENICEQKSLSDGIELNDVEKNSLSNFLKLTLE